MTQAKIGVLCLTESEKKKKRKKPELLHKVVFWLCLCAKLQEPIFTLNEEEKKKKWAQLNNFCIKVSRFHIPCCAFPPLFLLLLSSAVDFVTYNNSANTSYVKSYGCVFNKHGFERASKKMDRGKIRVLDND